MNYPIGCKKFINKGAVVYILLGTTRRVVTDAHTICAKIKINITQSANQGGVVYPGFFEKKFAKIKISERPGGPRMP